MEKKKVEIGKGRSKQKWRLEKGGAKKWKRKEKLRLEKGEASNVEIGIGRSK